MYGAAFIILAAAVAAAVHYSIKYMDIFNPMLLLSLPVFLQYCIYLIFYRNYGLQKETLFIICASVLSFLCSCWFCLKTKRKITDKNKTGRIYVNTAALKLYMLVAVTGFLLGIIEMVKNGRNGEGSFFVNVRINEIYGEGKNFYTKYSAVFLFVSAIVYLYSYLLERKKKCGDFKYKKKTIFILLTALMASPLFTMARTEIFTYILSVSCIIYSFYGVRYRKNFVSLFYKYRKIVFVFAVLIAAFFFFGLVTGRAGNASVMDENFFLYRYTGYTLITFDQWYLKNPGVNGVISVLGPFQKILLLMGIPLTKQTIVPGWAGYNVGGYYGELYVGAGFLGLIIINLLLGYFTTWLYMKARTHGGYYLLFYSSYLSAAAISFFAYQFCNTFHFYILGLLLLLQIRPGFKFYYVRKRI